MSRRSIYRKACPSCSTSVELAATQCVCGYLFDASSLESGEQMDEPSMQDDELLKEYLQARIGQAVEELKGLQTALAADPKNIDKANRLMKTYVALHDLRTEFGSFSPDDDATRATSAEPGEAFRAAQSLKAEQVMKAAGMNTKACPKCHAVMPEQAALCFCGFAFTHDSADVPQHTAAPAATTRKNV